MKKTVKNFVLNMLGAFALIAVVALVFRGACSAQDRVDAYERERNEHVVSVWGDGKDHPDHQCEYGPEWCNPVHCRFLLENKVLGK